MHEENSLGGRSKRRFRENEISLLAPISILRGTGAPSITPINLRHYRIADILEKLAMRLITVIHRSRNIEHLSYSLTCDDQEAEITVTIIKPYS